MKKTINCFWQGFKKTPPGRLIRFLSPQWLVNLIEHLPIAVLANVIYGFPSRKITIIGITGTDGKTTTVNMIYKILKDAGLKISMISTINAVLGNKTYDTGFHVTSPHSFIVQEFIKKALSAGSDYLILEVTSQGLDQHRFWGVKFKIGVITNISSDHLDYHKTFKNYLKSKAKLIQNADLAILNQDDPNFADLTQKTNGTVVSFGLSKKADFNPAKFPFKLKIPSDYNIANALAASATASSLNINRQTIKKSLEAFNALPGRMEEIENDLGVKIIVDFAHTPNALKEALKALRPKNKNRLITVFGCAGLRDRGRREMGMISAQLSDITIITAEDPRTEKVEDIIEEIAAWARQANAIEIPTQNPQIPQNKHVYLKIPDRKEAIEFALKIARPHDIVDITGKGHEKSMCYGTTEHPWSDQEVVRKLLSLKKS